MTTPSNAPSKYQGFLFFNTTKASESYPDVSGKLTLDGKEWAIAAWERTKDNKKFLVVSARVKDGPGVVAKPGNPSSRSTATSGTRSATPSPRPANNASSTPAPLHAPNGLPNSPFSGGVSRSVGATPVEEPKPYVPPSTTSSSSLPPPPFPSFTPGTSSGNDEGEMNFDDIFKTI